MYLYLFWLLLSSGASGYFLPLKGTAHLQNKTKDTIIDEMLCLLEAENHSTEEKFLKPIHIKDQICAHSNTKRFIQELKKMTKYQCMQRVEKDMKSLEEICSILKKSSSHDKICCKSAETDFSQFKKGLEEFLKWVNEKKDCSNIVRSELGLYPDGNCVCHDQWKYRKGLL